MNAKKKDDLPQGTLETYRTMHTWLRRGLFVCLSALVIEGTFTVPLLLIWMGWPDLTPLEICSEMNKVRYDDETFECQFPIPLGAPPENVGRKTAKDKWSIQPTPGYRRIGFRDLVRNRDARLARQAAAQANK